MSPLQFQKRMRLQAARRLMLGEGLDAAGAGRRVGYGDASQFTREYKSLFGAPPMRDAERLREAAATGVASLIFLRSRYSARPLRPCPPPPPLEGARAAMSLLPRSRLRRL